MFRRGTIRPEVRDLPSRRTRKVREAVLARHVIPNRNALDVILRYQSGIERDLGRAVDRLERLQRRRRGRAGPASRERAADRIIFVRRFRALRIRHQVR
jgi:hypothetical protein